jgi:phosphoenolpyruvate-protein phosphotransferase/dihydroxyacetone kinase phosphotransfer subunit
MIGIVIVSHSATLAAGVRELARQMVRDRVPIAIAGGLDDAEEPIGTDPFRVLAAIESVYSDDGVIVFMDIGSAVLSAETALDFLPAAQRPNVHLSAAPLVEGVIAAAVRAMTGSPVADVLAEANGALTAKSAQLSLVEPPLAIDDAPSPESGSASIIAAPDPATLIVQFQQSVGLHARPAARLVNIVGGYDAEVLLTKAETTIPATSINQILALAVEPGDTITFHASGPQASEALAAVRQLVESNFDEPDAEPVPMPAIVSITGIDRPADVEGTPVSPGVVYGPVVRFQPAPILVESGASREPVVEWGRLYEALTRAQSELSELQAQSESHIGETEAAIFAAQMALLDDPDLQQLAHDLIFGQRISAESAWLRVTGAVSRRLTNIGQPYWHQRMADVEDIQQRVLRILSGSPAMAVTLDHPAILLAEDMPPTLVAQLPRDRTLGIVLQQGGATSHSAILARSLGIPMVASVADHLDRVREGQCMALDGYSGRLWIEPDESLCAAIDELRLHVQASLAANEESAHEPGMLADGKRIPIYANLSSVQEAEVALEQGAEGVGLFRSEFLYMNRAAPPSEDEQFAAYSASTAALGGRPVTIRTLDVGGDKPVDYLTLPSEVNPALGWRGIRYWLDRPEIARTQLRAILRTAAEHPVKLMLPMVSTVEELWETRMLIKAVCSELHNAGVAHDGQVEIGVMVETPAAVLMASQLAAAVAFFSIGTNDLTQYLMAADRANPQVAELSHPLQPAVLRSIQWVVQAAHQAGIRVAVCGELAGDPRAAALLVGLGVDELSMNLPAIPGVKAALRKLTLPQVIMLADGALQLPSATDVENYLLRQLPV